MTTEGSYIEQGRKAPALALLRSISIDFLEVKILTSIFFIRPISMVVFFRLGHVLGFLKCKQAVRFSNGDG